MASQQPDIEFLAVDQTGLAVVRAGEAIVPAPGSEALLSVLRGDGTLVLEFPIEVEVRIVDSCDPERHADVALQRLVQALDGLA